MWRAVRMALSCPSWRWAGLTLRMPLWRFSTLYQPVSKTHSMAARRLPDDWQQRYGCRPVLLETFVQVDRYGGTCYRAANWVHLGQTVGRGNKAAAHMQILLIKNVWTYRLLRDYLSVLTA